MDNEYCLVRRGCDDFELAKFLRLKNGDPYR
jgi:hypothetical protein